MTVKDLIASLKEMNPDAVVVIACEVDASDHEVRIGHVPTTIPLVRLHTGDVHDYTEDWD